MGARLPPAPAAPPPGSPAARPARRRRRPGGQGRYGRAGTRRTRPCNAATTRLGGEHGPDRLVAAAEPLGDRLDVGRHTLLLPGVQRAGAPHAAHHLIEDQQRAVTVADVAHGTEVNPPAPARSPTWHPPPSRATKAATVPEPSRWNSASSSAANRAVKSASVSASPLLTVGESGRDVAEGRGTAGEHTVRAARHCRPQPARRACCRGSFAGGR